MLLFADTEFTDFETLSPLSVALVSECGNHEFYVEISDCSAPPSDFVQKIVLPLMDGGAALASYSEASARLSSWLDALPDPAPKIIVDYEGDWSIIRAMLIHARHSVIPSALMLFPAFLNACLERGISGLEIAHDAAQKMPALMEPHFIDDPRRHHALVDARATRLGWVQAMARARRTS